MRLPRRRFLHLASGAIALPVVSRIATAQAYPTRPVRIVVGFAAGGSADIVARLMAALEPDEVVLGGGNVKELKKLPPGCRAVNNASAFCGGFRLWEKSVGSTKPLGS